MELRPYQTDLLARIRSSMLQGNRSILTVAPTGSGKTALTAEMIRGAAAKSRTCWFIVHRRELLKQSIRAFNLIGVNHGVIASSFLEDRRPGVQIASIQTLKHRYARFREPDLIVYDEAHHCAAGSWSLIRGLYPKAFHVGLTATPERLDGAGLGKWFSVMLEGPSISWLIEQGWLSPYRLFAPNSIDTTGVSVRMGDFAKSESARIVDKPTITGDAIREYKRAASGKRAVVFCVSIEHSKHVVEQFNAAGIKAAHVDGETDPSVRDQTLRQFQDGAIQVLSNVELFGEGFDLPGLDCVIMLRPTMSLGLYLQQVGRALRPIYADGYPTATAAERRAAIAAGPKPYAILIDHVGNSERHWLPDDERQWTLEGRPRGKKTGERLQPMKVCPRCFAAQSIALQCRFCGFAFNVQPRVVEEVAGDLIEVDPAVLKRKRLMEQSTATTLEDLISLGRARGYKKPEAWAKHIFSARQVKKLTQGKTG